MSFVVDLCDVEICEIHNLSEIVVLGKCGSHNILIVFNSAIKEEEARPILEKVKTVEVVIQNDEYYNLLLDGQYSVRVVYPAKEKYMKILDKKYRVETPEQYTVRLHIIKEQWSDNTKWIRNIIDCKTEIPIYECRDFLVITNYKWDGDRNNLSLLLFYKSPSAYTVRELNSNILKRARSVLVDTLHREYHMDSDECIFFIHYPPKYFMFHIHVSSLKRKMTDSQSIGRALLLDDVIENLVGDEEYYKHKTLYFIE